MSTKDDRARFHELLQKRRADTAARLAAAKEEAARIGKEPFDLDKFNQYPHPEENGSREAQIANYEIDYYLSSVVRRRDVRTIEDYAKLLMELDVFKDAH